MASLLAVAVQGWKVDGDVVAEGCVMNGMALCPKECLIRVIHGASA